MAKDKDIKQIIAKHVKRIKREKNKNGIKQDTDAIWEEVFPILNSARLAERKFRPVANPDTAIKLPVKTDKSGCGILDASSRLIGAFFTEDQHGRILPAPEITKIVIDKLNS